MPDKCSTIGIQSALAIPTFISVIPANAGIYSTLVIPFPAGVYSGAGREQDKLQKESRPLINASPATGPRVFARGDKKREKPG